jgi:hypothetical protein
MTPQNPSPSGRSRKEPTEITLDLEGEEQVFINERTLAPSAGPHRPLTIEELAEITIDCGDEEEEPGSGQPKAPSPPSS